MSRNKELTVTGEHVEVYRLMSLRQALLLETKGLQISRGSTAYSRIKSELGFKGNKKKVLDQFTRHLSNEYGVNFSTSN